MMNKNNDVSCIGCKYVKCYAISRKMYYCNNETEKMIWEDLERINFQILFQNGVH